MDYPNFSWCGDAEDKKSTVGYVFMLGGMPVAWSSRKELVVSLPSCETEYITSSLCACQATLMMNIVEEIIGNNHGAMTMKINSMSAINLTKNLIAHRRSKHIKMRFHYLREHVANGKLSLEHCRSGNLTVDIIMKVVKVKLFKRLNNDECI